MKIYKVGGSVRDKIQENQHKIMIMLSLAQLSKKCWNKAISVGKDFPVFLHPETNEEYALARKERKISLGHKGFDFTLEKDVILKRIYIEET